MDPLPANVQGVGISSASVTFGSTRALRDVDLMLRRGEIHALLGQNGAGKSTLFKVLAGVYSTEPGFVITVDGRRTAGPITPLQSQDFGFKFVHQDLALVDSMTVTENVCIQDFITSVGRIRWRATQERVRDLLSSLGVDVAPTAVVGQLPQALKAGVAITRALYSADGRRPSLLVLDEPTAHLTVADRDRLFESMTRAAQLGTAVVFSTHRLDEVLEISDAISVLRDGRIVWSGARSEIVDEDDLITKILGLELTKFYPHRIETHDRELRLDVRNLVGTNVRGLDLQVHRGEIVGLTGLIGAGHDDVPYLLIGAQPATEGSVAVDSREGALTGPPHAAQLGVGLLPADRIRHSGVPGMTVRENITMTTLRTYTRNGRIRRRAERQASEEIIDRYDVRPRGSAEFNLSALSGGNQQKALLARLLARKDLRVLVLHEPTQGVDIGAKQELLRFIAEAATEGTAVLMVSTDNEDLSNLCDRVLVMRHGRVRADLVHPTPDQIAEHCLMSAAGQP